MAKISEKKKVELLEHAVVFGTAEDVRAILDQYQPIDFLARALGLAAMCGDLEKVQALVDFGADFGYEDTPTIRSSYGTVYRSQTAAYYSHYHLLPLYKGQNVAVPMLSANVSQFHFGKYDYSNVPVADEDSRYKVVEYLLSKPSVFFSGEELLYYAILWDCPTVVPLLKERYPSLSETYTNALIESSHSLIKDELWSTLTTMSADAATGIVTRFVDCVLEGNRVLLPPYVLQQSELSWCVAFLEAAIDRLDASRVSSTLLFELAIRNKNDSFLDLLLKKGFANHHSTFDVALRMAQSLGNVSATAMLLNFNNQNGVLIKYNGTDRDVVIPDGTTEIGDSAFCDFRSITSVAIPDSVTKIGEKAFEYCRHLSSVTLPTGLKTIAPYTFSHCSALKEVTIPEGVTEISEGAFWGCTSLTSITIPHSVTKIDDGAFCGCIALTEVTIPEGVTKVGDYAFRGCTALVSIDLPETVTELGERTLAECPKLTYVVTRKKALFDRIWKELPREHQVRLLVKAVREHTTDPNMLAKIKANRARLFAKSVEQDDEAAVVDLFSLCKNVPLEQLDEYVRLAEKAPKVRAVVLSYKNQWYSPQYQAEQEEIRTDKEFGLREKTLTDWKKEYNLKKQEDCYLISGYRGQETMIIVPSQIGGLPVVVEDKAFSPSAARLSREQADVRTRIQAVTFAEGITKIGNGVFLGCTSLTSVTLSGGITEIGDETFSGCTALTEVNLPNSVTKIGGFAFQGCTSLTSITIPDCVTKIGGSAFVGCTSLTCVTIPDGVTEIDNFTFEGCTSLVTITIPDSVTRIKWLAFHKCRSLATITIPDSVTEIDNSAFARCSALTEVNLPNGVTRMNGSTFEGCTSLTSVAIPGSVTDIDDYAFEGCTSLATITIPDSVTKIGGFAFRDCTSLATITIPDSVAKIDTGTFSGCTALTKVTIPNSVTEIGDSAFWSCTSLAFVTIPDRVTRIGGRSFLNCTSLAAITIPDGVTEIGVSAFYRCAALTEVTIPDSVTEIGDGAFTDCPNLTIHAPADSAAARYAQKNDIPFVAI